MKTHNRLYLIFQLILLSLYSSTAQASLIGANPGLPTISFSGAGFINYQLDNAQLSIYGSPSSLFSATPFILQPIHDFSSQQNKSLEIHFQVDQNGVLLANNLNQPDLLLNGAIDIDGDGVIDYSGSLLTAEVFEFGFFNDPDGNDDIFDLRFNQVQGALAYLYNDHSLEARIISESSYLYPNAFDSSFSHSWQGQATGVIGLGPRLDSSLTSIPIPAAIWLWSGALLSLFPAIKSSKNNG